jgi:hypothetical protein
MRVGRYLLLQHGAHRRVSGQQHAVFFDQGTRFRITITSWVVVVRVIVRPRRFYGHQGGGAVFGISLRIRGAWLSRQCSGHPRIESAELPATLFSGRRARDVTTNDKPTNLPLHRLPYRSRCEADCCPRASTFGGSTGPESCQPSVGIGRPRRAVRQTDGTYFATRDYPWGLVRMAGLRAQARPPWTNWQGKPYRRDARTRFPGAGISLSAAFPVNLKRN